MNNKFLAYFMLGIMRYWKSGYHLLNFRGNDYIESTRIFLANKKRSKRKRG